MLRILVADDQGAVLNEVNRVLRASHNVVASASNGNALLRAAAAVSPDLIVTDISMPEMNGIDVARQLRKTGSKAKIIFLSVHREPEIISAAFEAGAEAYVFKEQLLTDMAAAIDHVLSGDKFLSKAQIRDPESQARKTPRFRLG